MKVSVVTPCFNSKETISLALDSVLAQGHTDIELIVIDGGSTDGTVEIVKSYGDRIQHFVSEPDNGIYDAMNKGIRLASGEIVGILNSDDVYAKPTVLSRVAEEFAAADCDCVFADVVFVAQDDPERITRYYSSARFRPALLSWGWMPAHPSMFVRRQIYSSFGLFRTDYAIAADYELVVRIFHKHQVSYRYIPEVFVKMRTGGASTHNLNSNWTISKEIVRACRANGIETTLPKVLLKYPLKLLELVRKPPENWMS